MEANDISKEEYYPSVKFSHNYFKFRKVFLNDKRQATLLQAFKINSTDLSGEFREYDTRYGDYNEDVYPLPDGELILLVFKALGTDRLFTTIRSYNSKKFAWYRDNEGKIFDIVIL
jgi:hypothetical protein